MRANAVVTAIAIFASCAGHPSGGPSLRRSECARSDVERALPPLADDPVVLLTIDGVRWQEIFEGTDSELWASPKIPAAELVPNLYRLGTERGAFIGAPSFGVIRA